MWIFEAVCEIWAFVVVAVYLWWFLLTVVKYGYHLTGVGCCGLEHCWYRWPYTSTKKELWISFNTQNNQEIPVLLKQRRGEEVHCQWRQDSTFGIHPQLNLCVTTGQPHCLCSTKFVEQFVFAGMALKQQFFTPLCISMRGPHKRFLLRTIPFLLAAGANIKVVSSTFCGHFPSDLSLSLSTPFIFGFAPGIGFSF